MINIVIEETETLLNLSLSRKYENINYKTTVFTDSRSNKADS